MVFIGDMGTSGGGHPSDLRPTFVRIDLGALARNFARIRDLVAPRRVWCVVKADAYGHGAVEVARRLAAAGAGAFAVATVDEGIELREAGIEGEILLMGGIEPLAFDGGGAAPGVEANGPGGDGGSGARAGDLGGGWSGARAGELGGDRTRTRDAAAAVAHYRLSVAVWGPQAAVELGAAARRAETGPVDLHLKADTGMGRLGVRVDDSCDAAVELARKVAATEGVRLAGLFSNLAAADAPPGAPGAAHTAEQVGRFGRLCATLDEAGLLPEHRHLANSAAIQQHADSWAVDWCNGVRPGLALYGASLVAGGGAATAGAAGEASRGASKVGSGTDGGGKPVDGGGSRAGPHGGTGAGDVRSATNARKGDRALPASPTWPRLEPVMSWHSAVAAVREVPAGWPLGYGAGRRAERAGTIGVVPVGYHDGLPRALGDRAEVLVAGRRAKVVGAISMDLTLVDISGIPGARVGAPVVIFGRSAAPGGGAIAVEEVAGWAGSIAHEVLCRVSKRVPRRFVETVS